jgi:hypothetical protein
MWIWIGIGYNLGLGLLLTAVAGILLMYTNPPKVRPTTPADETAVKTAAASAAIRKNRTERFIKSSESEAPAFCSVVSFGPVWHAVTGAGNSRPCWQPEECVVYFPLFRFSL